jgi:hypothetical protein
MDDTNRGKVGAVKRLIKDKAVQVLLTGEDLRVLDRAVAREREERRDVRVSRGMLLREVAMPQIRALVEKEVAA